MATPAPAPRTKELGWAPSDRHRSSPAQAGAVRYRRAPIPGDLRPTSRSNDLASMAAQMPDTSRTKSPALPPRLAGSSAVRGGDQMSEHRSSTDPLVLIVVE